MKTTQDFHSYLSHLLKSRPVKNPGSRGGRHWVDRKGTVRYGPKPQHMHEAEARHRQWHHATLPSGDTHFIYPLSDHHAFSATSGEIVHGPFRFHTPHQKSLASRHDKVYSEDMGKSERVQSPGSRGGTGYWDGAGTWRYGQRPTEQAPEASRLPQEPTGHEAGPSGPPASSEPVADEGAAK